MRFRIRHITRYRYSKPVFLEPHTLRFLPRSDSWQTVEHSAIHIDPTPGGMTYALDEVGNSAAYAWFSGLHERLTITSECTVLTMRENPFDFILDSSAVTLPVNYPQQTMAALAIYQQRHSDNGLGHGDDPVGAFVRGLLEETNRQTLPFLNLLNHRLYEQIKVIQRDFGDAHPPAKTWLDKCGACRDQAVLFVDCCRAAGLAARFVGGYHDEDTGKEPRQLHAWGEVYLPLAGWRGFDPTHALAVADHNVVLAAGPTPAHAIPLTGSFRGTGATAELEHEISIETA